MNENEITTTDKQALINLAIGVIEMLWDIGKSEEEIVCILKGYGLSDLMIEQILY